MKSLRVLLAISLTISALVAPVSAAQEPQDAKGATIHGFLFDGLTASRMEGTVTLQDTNRRTIKQTLTRGGEYRLSDIPEGRYFLHAQDYGVHVPQDYGQVTPDSPPAELFIGAAGSYELSFTLERAGKISGTVTDPNGRPVTTAEVQLLLARYDPAGNRFLTSTSVPPARVAGGNYSFSFVPPGEFFLRATMTLPAEQYNAVTPANHNVRTYYPGVKEPELAVMVEMTKEPRNIQNVNFLFKDVSQFKITGKIVYPPQRNIREPLYIYLVPRDNFRARLVDPPLPAVDFDQARESFELRNVQPGSYDLYIASVTDYAPAADGAPGFPGYSARIPVQVRDSDVVDLVAELEPGVDLNGEFKLDGGGDALKVDQGRLQPVFIPQDGKPWPLAPGASANPNTFVQSNGTFNLIHAAAGQYRIGAVIPENLYLADAWLGPRNIMGQTFEIDGRTEGPLVLELSSAGAKFEGTVTDVNNAPANAQVVLVPPTEFRNDPGASKAARTDKDGSFMISGIRPGVYTVYAFPKIDTNAWLNDEFMNSYRALGLQINFAKGAHVYRDLESIPLPK